jgi:hypothetical protein
VFLLFFPVAAFTQNAWETELRNACNTAASDSERITRLDHLAQYYFSNSQFQKGDSVIERQIMVAEASQQRPLILRAYFNNAGFRTTGATSTNRSGISANYIQRALAYAKANDLPDYVALAYSKLSASNVNTGMSGEALKHANLAFTSALNTPNDSIKVLCAIQLGHVYLQRSDVVMAFRTYLNAQNIALEDGRKTLLPPVFHAIAMLYKKLGNEEIAKKYVHRSYGVNNEIRDAHGKIEDLIFLAKMSNYIAGKEYLQQAVSIADSTGDAWNKIEAEKILFFHMLLREKPAHMLEFLGAHPELENAFENFGPHYKSWMIGEIYLYGGMPDSALVYFKTAEDSFIDGYDLNIRKNFFGEFAYCYQLLNDVPQAIGYYRLSFDISQKASDLMALKSYSREIKGLYEQSGNYEQAYAFSLLYDRYKDSVDILGREKDLALLEIDNVTKQQQREAEVAQDQQRRKYNLQYMLITLIVAAVFLLLIMVGMFKVSEFTIRVMGFFSLIFLFEFIILVLDNRIHHLTHGEPWKVWLIKIAIISFLLPLHHILEKRLIKYLLSRHLIIIRNRLSPGSLFKGSKKKKPEPEAPANATVED